MHQYARSEEVRAITTSHSTTVQLAVPRPDGLPRKATLVLDDPDDFIQRRIRETQDFYERPLLDYLAAAFAGRALAFIDLGSNIGNHSVYMGLALDAKLLCVEPRRDTFARLTINIRASGLDDRATCVRAAVGAEESRGVSVTTEANNLGGAEVVLCQGEDDEGDFPVHTLDNLAGPFLDGHHGAIIVKIDVEGMEESVLAGMKELLQRHRPTIVVECTSDAGFVGVARHLRRLDYGVATMFFKSATFVCAPADELAELQRHALTHSWTLARQYVEYCRLHRVVVTSRPHIEKLAGIYDQLANRR